jgi:hypothetical protein
MRRHRPRTEYLHELGSFSRLGFISPHFDEHWSPPPTALREDRKQSRTRFASIRLLEFEGWILPPSAFTFGNRQLTAGNRHLMAHQPKADPCSSRKAAACDSSARQCREGRAVWPRVPFRGRHALWP